MTAASSTSSSAAAFVRDNVTWLSYLSLGYLIFIESSLGPAMPSLRAELGLSYTAASLHFTAIAGGAVIAAWFGDRIARRLGRRRAFWTGSLGVLVGIGLIVVSPTIVGTLAGSLILGMLGALMSVVIQAGLADHHGEQRAIALTEVNMSASAGAIVGAVAVGAFERTALGWRGAEVIFAILWMVAAFFLRHAEFSGAVPPAAGRHSTGRLPKLFWICCLIGMASAGAEWGFVYWGADFMHRVIGFSESGAAIAMGCFFFAMAGGRMAGARLASKWNNQRFVIWTLVVAAIGFPIFWLSREPAIVIGGLVLVGLGIANVYPLIASIATGLVPGQADVAISRLMFTGSMAVLAAPFALGVLGDLFGIEAAFVVIIPLLITAICLSVVMNRNTFEFN